MTTVTIHAAKTHLSRLIERADAGEEIVSVVRAIGGFSGEYVRISGGNSPVLLRVDVSETEQELKVRAELPGVDEKDVEVMLASDVLTIKGEKRVEEERKGENHHVVERSYGSFARSLRLPAGIDQAQAHATFDKGVLTVTLRKTFESGLRKTAEAGQSIGSHSQGTRHKPDPAEDVLAAASDSDMIATVHEGLTLVASEAEKTNRLLEEELEDARAFSERLEDLLSETQSRQTKVDAWMRNKT